MGMTVLSHTIQVKYRFENLEDEVNGRLNIQGTWLNKTSSEW
jgi:hypothetical protein